MYLQELIKQLKILKMKIEVSNGEIVDKLTILEIKADRIKDKEKLKNILAELESLKKIFNELNVDKKLYIYLLRVNYNLYDIENDIRDKENNKEFDKRFIQLARLIYTLNDSRAKIKKQINIETKSSFIEEKSYH